MRLLCQMLCEMFSSRLSLRENLKLTCNRASLSKKAQVKNSNTTKKRNL